ncbi:MAG: hypothetical protein AAF862_12750 [Pseudomonadota bacterium]
MLAWLEHNATIFIAAMVHANIKTAPAEFLILNIGPRLAPTLDHGAIVPFTRLFAKTISRQRARGEQNMGVVIPLVSQFMTVGPMNGEVRNHAMRNTLLIDKAPDQIKALLVAQLMGQGNHDFTGKLGVFAALNFFNAIPELGAVIHPLRRIRRRPDLSMNNALFAGVVMLDAGALILHSDTGAIGGCARCRTAGAAAYNIHAHGINRHYEIPRIEGRSFAAIKRAAVCPD